MSEWIDAEPDEERFAQEMSVPLGALRERGRHCPAPDLVLAASAGVLPPELAAEVAGHVAECRLCRALSEDLIATAPGPTSEEMERIRAKIRAQAPAPARQVPRRMFAWIWSPVPAFAVLVVAAAGAFWLYRAGTLGPPSPPPRVAPPVAAVAAVPPPPVLPLEKPPVRLPLSTSLIWRGGAPDAQQQRYLEDLGLALAPYRDGEFAEAGGRLESLAQKRPTPEVLFYLGVCRVFIGRYDGAVQALAEARQAASPPLAEEAAWYLAVAYERAGRVTEAAGELERLCRAGSARRAEACVALTQLKPSGR